jgi:hypothetical protein
MSKSNLPVVATFCVSSLSLAVSGVLYWELIGQHHGLPSFLQGQNRPPAESGTAVSPPAALPEETTTSPIDDLRKEVESLRKLLASATVVSPDSGGASPKDVPLALKQFLEELRTPAVLMEKGAPELEKLRGELVSIINAMPGARRDELREEIALANWVLEALDNLASGTAGTVEGRMSEFVVLNGLVESDPVQVPPQLKAAIDRQFEDQTARLSVDLKTVVESLRRSGLTIPEAEVRRGELIYDLLNDAGADVAGADGEACGLFLAIRRWMENSTQIAAGDAAGGELAARRSLVLLQEGEALRDQLFKLGFSEPQEFQRAVELVSGRAEELIARDQKALSANYQLWALERIEMARDFGAGDVSVRIEEFLKQAKDDPSASASNPLHQTMLREFPNFREKLGQLAGIPGLKASEVPKVDADLLYNIAAPLSKVVGWKGTPELEQSLMKDVIRDHLLKIDENLLDRPVASLFTEVFDQCWNHDAALPIRVELAKMAATGTKATLTEIAQGQNQKPK